MLLGVTERVPPQMTCLQQGRLKSRLLLRKDHESERYRRLLQQGRLKSRLLPRKGHVSGRYQRLRPSKLNLRL